MAATASGVFFFVFKSSTSRQSDWSSRINTLNDSGNPAVKEDWFTNPKTHEVVDFVDFAR